ncbi:hypothetical protein ACCS37_32265 [Rhizobium ruizarguesonis]
MSLNFVAWKPDADVYGEAAGMSFGERVFDLVVTYGHDEYPWDVVDGCQILASGVAESASEARRAAETAGRREGIRVV